VSAIPRALGFFDRTAAFAGASAGAIAAAYSCSKNIGAQLTFRAGVAALLTACNLPGANHCKGTLDFVLRANTLSTTCGALKAPADCANKLHVAVTQANANSLGGEAGTDRRVFVSGT
jgi:hypothetical protein